MGSNPLAEAAKKNRPEIVELLQDAINCSIPSSGSTTGGSQDEPVFAGGPTSSEFKRTYSILNQVMKQLQDANNTIKTQDKQIKQLQAEIDFHEQESAIKTDQMNSICDKYRNDSLEKDELVRAIKRDIDLVEMDVKKSNQLLQAEQDIRESLEDENIKLLEMIRQREKTIKNLEVKTRNALEISIKADDAIRSNTDRVKRLEQENAALKEAQTKNSETKTDEKVKAKADNMAKQDDFVTFGLNLVSKINDLNTAVVELTKQNTELKTQLAAKPKERIVEKIVEKRIEVKVEVPVATGNPPEVVTPQPEACPEKMKSLEKSLSMQEELNKALLEEQKAAEKELEVLQADVLSLIKAKIPVSMSSSKITESDSCPNLTTCSTTESETENNASEKIENLKDEISVLHQENAYLARRLNKLEDPKRKS